MGSSVVSYCKHLGKHVGSLGTCQKCIKSLMCSHIGNLMWTHMIDNVVCTWWEDIENIKIKKCSKLPLVPKRKKIKFLGACCITSLGKAKFLSPKMFVILFQSDLLLHSLINLRWTIISYTTLNLELVICLMSESTQKTLGEPQEKFNDIFSHNNACHMAF
jgi:hypothetical protein